FVAAAPHLGSGNDAVDRRNVDHPAPPPLQHRTADHLGADERLGQVQVDDLLPLVQRHFFGGEVNTPAAYVVDQDINRAEVAQHLFAEGDGTFGRGQV